MKKPIKNTAVVTICLFALTFVCYGCDPIYRVLQKEGAEEKDLFGVIVPHEKNMKVEEIQKILKLYGYKVGKADGILGANTRKAIKQFQEDNHLKPTRFVDKKTWRQLTVFERYGLIIDGELNIYAIQVALNTAGIDTGKPDGKMGKRTLSAIRRFQDASGLKPDGKVGFKTINALSQYLEVVEK